jgi:hypothetical protein
MCRDPFFDFRFNRKLIAISEAKTLKAVKGTYNSCNRKGTKEKTATPISTDSEINKEGFKQIFKRHKTPNPARNCSTISSMAINSSITGPPGIF